MLVRAGFDVGKVDGVLGQQSRTRREGDAGQIRPAGGFLADRGAAREHARRPASASRALDYRQRARLFFPLSCPAYAGHPVFQRRLL